MGIRLLLISNSTQHGRGYLDHAADALQRNDLIGPIRSHVGRGMSYIGSSAGSIVACPTLKTTKDMPVIQPLTFDALGLVPFQISPHYLDPDPSSTHMGETQEERIAHYHEANDLPVVGLRDGSMLLLDAGSLTLKGRTGARLFEKGLPPIEHTEGARLDHLPR